MPERFFFSTDALPLDMSDAAKAGFLYDLINSSGYRMDAVRDEQRPFHASHELVALGGMQIEQAAGTTLQATRNRSHIAQNAADSFRLFINRSGSFRAFDGPAHQFDLQQHQAAFMSSEEPGTLHMTSGSNLEYLTFPVTMISERLPGFGDLLSRPIPPSDSMRMLARVTDLIRSESADMSPTLVAQMQETLLGLLSLALRPAAGSPPEERNLRGLRHARTLNLISILRARYSDPGFSTSALAREAGLTPRYVNMLLSETGLGFTERILELRLQKAAELLRDRHHDHKRISEIAYTCGFNDISYFNRSFRRRFGCAPGDLR